jgi:hypothetical protein
MIRRLIPIVIFLQALKTYAQPEKSMFSFSAIVAVPTAEFNDAVNNESNGMGVGFNTNLLFNPKSKNAYSPVFFGGDFSYISFGRDKQPASGNLPAYKTTFNYYSINGIARLFLTDKTEGFTPFVDGMLGMKIYNTRTKIDKDLLNTVLNDDQPEVIHTTNDTGLDYGVGVGFYKRKFREAGEGKGSLTLRVAYLWGDKIQYVKRGSLKVDAGTIDYETSYANTSMFLIQLGFNLFN